MSDLVNKPGLRDASASKKEKIEHISLAFLTREVELCLESEQCTKVKALCSSFQVISLNSALYIHFLRL